MITVHRPGSRFTQMQPHARSEARAVHSLLIACLASALLLALAPSGADASVERSFNTFPTAPVASPSAIAVDNSTSSFAGDLYVLGGGTPQLGRFSASGAADSSFAPLVAFSLPFGIAVDGSGGSSAGDIYVADVSAGTVFKLSTSGSVLAEITAASIEPGQPGSIGFPGPAFGPASVSVDPSTGNLFVLDFSNEYVDIFDQSGTNTGRFPAHLTSAPLYIAADASANAYVSDLNGRLYKFTPSDGYSTPLLIDDQENAQLAADPSTDDLYVSKVHEIARYSPAGLILEKFGATELTSGAQGVTMNPASNRVYAALRDQDMVGVFGPPILRPDVETLPVSGVGPTYATLNGTVSASTPNPSYALTECFFEYGTTTSYGQTAPCVPAAADIPTDESDHAVTAQVTGLQAGTTYHFRLVAANVNGQRPGGEEAFEALPPPTVSGTSVSDVSARGATLAASVNPRGYPTAYRFEYIIDAAYRANLEEGGEAFAGASRAPGSDQPVGSGTTAVAVAQQLAGLQPDTAYHFRIVASNANGTSTGPERAFTTFALAVAEAEGECPNIAIRGQQGSTGLPDCRAYELVSTGDKSNGNAAPRVQATADGRRLALRFTSAASPDSGQANGVLASRTETGWTTSPVVLPNGPAPADFAPELASDSERVYVTRQAPSPADLNGEIDVYLRQPDGSFTWLTEVAIDGALFTRYNTYRTIDYAGRSDDFSRVVFESNQQLTPDAPGSPDGLMLYEADSRDGSLTYLGKLPGGGVAASSVAGSDSPGGTHEHAVAPDGSAVVFTSPDPAVHPQHSLYLWRSGKPTVEVSASRRPLSDPNGPQPADYWGASRDLSQIFFSSKQELTSDANTGAADNAPNLYRYNLSSGDLADLTVDTNAADTNGADLRGVVAISADGSYVYFVARGVLTTQPNSEGGVATAGQPNLYLWHNGLTTFIGELDNGDDATFGNGPVPSVVSGDGSLLLFMSHASLTGYDNSRALVGSCALDRCVELYLFSASTAQVICVSCNPSGERALGDASLPEERSWSTSRDPGHVLGEPRVARSISADGSRVFFTSGDRLAERAVNGRQNVYEWVADASHGCSRLGGCIRLLSDGTGRYDSVFANASADGSDVFFTTGDQLLPADTDTDIDLYDARVGGGFAAPPPSPAPCTGSDCRGSAPEPQLRSPLGSAAMTGPGNLRERSHRRRHRHHRPKRHRPRNHSRHRARYASADRGVAK